MAVKQKVGDTRPVVLVTNFSLLNATVVLKVKNGSDTPVDTTGQVTIQDYAGGVISWDHGGTLPVGTYRAELWITRDTELYKAPSDGYAELSIVADLA